MAESQSIWEKVQGWFSSPATHKVYARIPRERADLSEGAQTLTPYASYFRLWLAEMFLTDRVAWGRKIYPALNSEIHLDYGGLSQAISRVEQPKAPGVWRNVELVGLMPYNGGTVEIETALLGLPGEDYLQQAVGLLASVSKLVAPPFAPMVELAGKATTGLRDLVAGTGGQVHIGFHETLTSDGGGGPAMDPGYFAVVLATPRQVEPNRLSVQGDQLLYSRNPGEDPQPLEGFDYILIRVEGRLERDDWRLKDIQTPLTQALVALNRIPPDTSAAQAYQNAALAAALESPDIAELDRRRVIGAINAEISEITNRGLGAVGPEDRDLTAIVASRAIARAKSAALGLITAQEVFG